MSIYDVFSGGSKPFNKEEWAAQKQAQRKEAYELIDNTCSEVAVDGDSFRQYLDVQGRFDRYSVNNSILVSAQMPEATLLKDKSKWRENRVYVDKDAQEVVILEPSKEYTREDGTKAVSYNAKGVYDISETSASSSRTAHRSFPPKGEKLTRSVAPPLPTKSDDFAGTPIRQEVKEQKPIRELVSALIDASPVPFQPVDELNLQSLGEKKVALFALIPDNDTSFNFLVSILYTQLFQQLFYLADHKYGGRLPVHCHFIMDEFANVSLPDDFDKILSVMRSEAFRYPLSCKIWHSLKRCSRSNGSR